MSLRLEMEEPHEKKKGFDSQQAGFHPQKWLFGFVANNELNLSMLAKNLLMLTVVFFPTYYTYECPIRKHQIQLFAHRKNSGIKYWTCLFSWNVVRRVVVKKKTILQYNNNNMVCNELDVLSLAKLLPMS